MTIRTESKLNVALSFAVYGNILYFSARVLATNVAPLPACER
jgi:hypothetical protein